MCNTPSPLSNDPQASVCLRWSHRRKVVADGTVTFLVSAPRLLSFWTWWLSCEEHHWAPWLVGGCLEVEWKLFVEYVMGIVHGCSSPGDGLSLASHKDKTSFLSHFGLVTHRRALPPPGWETRIHPSPLHSLHQTELTDSNHNILEMIIDSGCLFQVASWFYKTGKAKTSN